MRYIAVRRARKGWHTYREGVTARALGYSSAGALAQGQEVYEKTFEPFEEECTYTGFVLFLLSSSPGPWVLSDDSSALNCSSPDVVCSSPKDIALSMQPGV